MMEHTFFGAWMAAGLMGRKHWAVGTGHAVCKVNCKCRDSLSPWVCATSTGSVDAGLSQIPDQL